MKLRNDPIEQVNDETQTVAEALGAAIAQYNRQLDSHGVDDKWVRDTDEWIEHLEDNYLPSGSGYDVGTTLDRGESDHDLLVFNTSFHMMDDVGSYMGWWDLLVTARPSFEVPLTVAVENLSLPEDWDDEEASERVQRAEETEGEETYGVEDLWDPVHDDDRIGTEFAECLSQEIPVHLRHWLQVPDAEDYTRDENRRVSQIVVAYGLHVCRFLGNVADRLSKAGYEADTRAERRQEDEFYWTIRATDEKTGHAVFLDVTLAESSHRLAHVRPADVAESTGSRPLGVCWEVEATGDWDVETDGGGLKSLGVETSSGQFVADRYMGETVVRTWAEIDDRELIQVMFELLVCEEGEIRWAEKIHQHFLKVRGDGNHDS